MSPIPDELRAQIQSAGALQYRAAAIATLDALWDRMDQLEATGAATLDAVDALAEAMTGPRTGPSPDEIRATMAGLGIDPAVLAAAAPGLAAPQPQPQPEGGQDGHQPPQG